MTSRTSWSWIGIRVNQLFFLPDPLCLPPPVSLFTVAHARASGAFVLNPFLS
jgi:hypothetical protein